MAIGKFIKFKTPKDSETEGNLDDKEKPPIKMHKTNDEEEK